MQKHFHDGVEATRKQRGIRCCLALHLVLAMTLAGTVSGSGIDNPKPTQFEVEAAYLLNFGKFVSWPQSHASTGPFVICVLGDDPFGAALSKTVAGEHVNSRIVEEKRITRIQDAAGCSIVYISISEASRISRILAALKDTAVLTVSEIPDFLKQGGMIQFVLRDGRVRFEVNLAPAEQDGLAMSSELLKVAVEVRRREGSIR